MVYLNARVKNLATRPWSGFKDKLVAMREFLATLPPTDVVCFVDGYDVTCFGLGEVLEVWTSSSAQKRAAIHGPMFSNCILRLALFIAI